MSNTITPLDSDRPWAELHDLIEASDAAGAAEVLADLSVEDQKLALATSRAGNRRF